MITPAVFFALCILSMFAGFLASRSWVPHREPEAPKKTVGLDTCPSCGVRTQLVIEMRVVQTPRIIRVPDTDVARNDVH